MKSVIVIFSIFISVPLLSQSISVIYSQELDDFINQVISDVGMPGAAVAVINNGKVIHRNNYGWASIEHEVPVSDRSSFQLYSLTKPIISVAIFKLIEEGVLDLEDDITTHIDGLPKAWSNVKVKHLMTHSTGLPDMFGSNPYELQDLTESQAKQRVFDMSIRFEAGSRFEYNQTNAWLLKELIESVSKEGLEDYIRRTQFTESDKESMYFLGDAREIVKHKTTSYFPWLKGHLTIDLPYVNGEYFYAGNGLHVTLNELIKWDQQFTANQLISKRTKEIMWTPFPYANDDEIFASGWNIHRTNANYSYGFTGSSVTMYRTIPEKELSVIFLANGFTNNYSQHALMDEIIRLVENQK